MSEKWVLVPEEPTGEMADHQMPGSWELSLATRPPVSHEWLDAAVERAAMALAGWRLWPGAWSQANEVERDTWLSEARAAILAALEMTDEP